MLGGLPYMLGVRKTYNTTLESMAMPNNSLQVSRDSRFFLPLGLQWNENELVRPQFFLNNVEELDFDGTRITFAGVCSPSVRH
jgi:hypothetical protein